MIVDDDAAVAIEDFAARRGDRQCLDAVAFGLLVVHLGILDLQVPEAGDQKQEDGYAGVLKNGDLAGRELDVFAADLLARRWGWLFEFRADDGRVHGGCGLSGFSLAGRGARKRRQRVSFVLGAKAHRD